VVVFVVFFDVCEEVAFLLLDDPELEELEDPDDELEEPDEALEDPDEELEDPD
jgi:hypothetical protein